MLKKYKNRYNIRHLTLSKVMLSTEVVRFPEREDTGLLPIRLLLSPRYQHAQ